MGDFYTHSMYSSSCGWSFNKRGTEGCATCYNYAENGVAYGLTYTMRLSIGKLKPTDEVRKGWKALGDAERPQPHALPGRCAHGRQEQER